MAVEPSWRPRGSKARAIRCFFCHRQTAMALSSAVKVSKDEPLHHAARVAPRESARHQREPDEQRQCPGEGDDASEEQAVVVRARCDGTRRLSGVGRTVCIG